MGAGNHEIQLADAVVTQLQVDHAFTLLIGDATVVRIETPFRLRRGTLD